MLLVAVFLFFATGKDVNAGQGSATSHLVATIVALIMSGIFYVGGRYNVFNKRQAGTEQAKK